MNMAGYGEFTKRDIARIRELTKRIRHKRRHVAENFDRLDAIRIAELASEEGSVAPVGYPRNIKYDNYRGNGKRSLRRMLQQQFPYARRLRYMVEECIERGVRAEPVLEAWTSRSCHRCGSTDTRRIGQSLFLCHDCGLQYNADWNSAIKIGSVLMPAALSLRATVGLAHAEDELAHKPTSPEGRKVAVLTSPCQHHEFSASLNMPV